MALNDTTLNKEQTQKRILLATVISFAFFIAYDFLYIQPKQLAAAKEHNQTTQMVSQQQNSAPIVTKQITKANPTPVINNTDTTPIISTIKTNKNIITIDNLGRVSQVKLLESKYVDKDGKQIKLFTPSQLKPLEVRFADTKINQEAFTKSVVASNSNIDATKNITKLTLTQKLSKTTLTKVFTFYPNGQYDIKISATNKADFFVTPGYRPNVLADMYANHGALLTLNDGTLKIIKDEDIETNIDLIGVNVASAFDRYYATLLYNYDVSMAVTVMKDKNNSPQMFIHGKDSIKLHGYFGPKEHKTLTALDKRLSNVIEYGWFTFIAKPMFLLLQFIHNYVGNWGWTIVLITILIKLILFPLSHKGMVSMNKLKELTPKVKAIQEKYANDKQKASMHMMQLYKDEGANPMGGCLPIILQIPIFFSLYRVLLSAIELKGSEWIFWIKDLSVMDPYYIIPILMGATMFLQQRITPNTMTDPVQQKMFQFLPVIFTFFFLWFPAGLTLYWFINNLATVAQQYYVNRIFAQNKTQRHEKHLKEKHHKK